METKENNEEYKLIVDGGKALEEIIKSINEAKKSIRIRVYMWRNDEIGNKILDLLNTKIKKNPQIKIYIEKDAFGTRVYNLQKYMSIGRIGGDIFSSKKGIKFLENKSNISFQEIGSKSIIFFKYLKENNHSKVFLFDENTKDCSAIIGGMNIANEYLTPQNRENPDIGGWHDFMVKITSELANKLCPTPKKVDKIKKWIFKKVVTGVELVIDIKHERLIRKGIFKELWKAKKSIIIEHGYITDYKIILALRKISRSGVNIKVILPSKSDGVRHANMHTIYKLLKPSLITRKLNKNLEIYLYDGMIHSKAILIDNKTAIIGSANLTYNSFNFLRETNAIFRGNQQIVKDLKNELTNDLKLCEKITLSNIPKYKLWLAIIQELLI